MKLSIIIILLGSLLTIALSIHIFLVRHYSTQPTTSASNRLLMVGSCCYFLRERILTDFGLLWRGQCRLIFLLLGELPILAGIHQQSWKNGMKMEIASLIYEWIDAFERPTRLSRDQQQFPSLVVKFQQIRLQPNGQVEDSLHVNYHPNRVMRA